jgi:hypothetical protein
MVLYRHQPETEAGVSQGWRRVLRVVSGLEGGISRCWHRTDDERSNDDKELEMPAQPLRQRTR